MARVFKSEIHRPRPAKIAYVNDLRNVPGTNYAYELKVNDAPVEQVESYYEGIIRKTRKDENGKSVRFVSPYADISDLGILCLHGNPGFEFDEDEFVTFPLYEDRNGNLVLDRDESSFSGYPNLTVAFNRAKAAFMASDRYKK